MSLHTFSQWLADTPASRSIREQAWVIPSVQCAHIVAICIVIGSMLLLNLRLLGIMGRTELASTYIRRYVPWAAIAIVALFLTGVLLIAGEPGRIMENWLFWTKMKLLAAGIVITSLFLAPVVRDSGYWDQAHRRGVAAIFALISSVIWVGIVVCGQWIAYVF